MSSYEVVEEQREEEGQSPYTMLNVVAKQEGETYIFHDVNLSRHKLEALIAICNREQVSPIHFDEVLLDYIKMDMENLKPEIIITK